MPIVTKFKYLKAAINHTATKDVRFYLCGVLLGNGFIAATSGFHAIIINDDNITGWNVIVPREVIKSMSSKLGRRLKNQDVSIEIKEGGYGLMSCMGEHEYFRFIEGKFPDIKKVDIAEPLEPIAEWVDLDFNYLHQFKKSIDVLTGSKSCQPVIKASGKTTAAYIALTDYAHGLLMPRRF